MDKENLYLSCLKMLNDKYDVKNYSKEKFNIIYTKIYKENNTSIINNEINKQILITIKNEFLNNNNLNSDLNNGLNNNLNNNDNFDNKIKELENIRATMNNIQPSVLQSSIQQLSINSPQIPIIQQQPLQPLQSQQFPIIQTEKTLTNFKTFIVNATKNNFKITSLIDIKTNYIYPCKLCIPSNIKNQTPYLIISINDGIKNINYTYIPSISNNIWDIWIPAVNNYIDVNLNNNIWNINIIDFSGINIDFNNYYYTINNVLENVANKTFTINVENSNNFNINDKIKIIQENNSINENIIIDKIIDNKNNYLLIIKKNNMSIDSFINAKVFKYSNQFSLIFKYISKL
jgi:hypothetical protein